jgi:hypothetical protein
MPYVRLPDRGFLLRGRCPGRSSPVRRRGQRSSPGPADRGTCWESGRSEPAGLWSRKKENLLKTYFYIWKRQQTDYYACVNIHIYLSPKNVSLFVAWILQRCSSRIYVFKDCKEYTQDIWIVLTAKKYIERNLYLSAIVLFGYNLCLCTTPLRTVPMAPPVPSIYSFWSFFSLFSSRYGLQFLAPQGQWG